MSDDEFYSDDDSDSSDEENEKPSINIKLDKETKYDSDSDSSSGEEDEEEENEEQNGGEKEEGEYSDEEDNEDPEDIELDEDGEQIVKKKTTSNNTIKHKKHTQLIVEDDDDDDDEFDNNYLQKFENDIIKNYVNEFHPECLIHNYDEIAKLSIVVRNADNIIIDPLHKTIPYLTKYEKARILGQRAKQIETGAKPLVRIPENIIDSYIIAELELREKKIPFIIRRPIPNGGCEYWKLHDLEVIAF